MGLLDDAIREHLDLKRRRGADPTEIERAEREALGPVRRQPEPIQEAPYPEGTGFPEGPAGGEEPEYPFPHEEDHAVAEAPAWPEEESHPPVPVEQWPDEEPHGAVPAEPWPGEEPPGAAPAERGPAEEHPLPHPAPADDPTSHLHQETAEYDVGFDHPSEPDEHPVEPGHEKQGEDMLEETPEFLQDTPDHDRLWFEQRPPKDFDFDE